MNIWIAGADGAIGRACFARLGANHNIYPMEGRYDVREKFEINKFLVRFGQDFDALVYAVGINHLNWSKGISTFEMHDLYNVNVVGLVRCLQLRPEIHKCVVIGSDAARRPMRTSIAYNASKAALEAAVKVIARERPELQINVVAPGLIAQSDMTEYVYQRTKELRSDLDLDRYMLDQIPMNRPGYPQEVAEVVRWLIEDAPPYLSGSVIDVNGAR